MRTMIARAGLALSVALCVGCGGAPAPKAAKAPAPAPKKSAAERIATAYAGPKIRVAVGDFEELENAKAYFDAQGWKGIGPLVTEQIVTGLVKTGRVAVLERQQIGKVVGNIQLEQESATAKYFDKKTTVEKGKLLGAQAMLVGALTQFEPNVEGGDVGVGIPGLASLTHHEDKAVVGVEVRLVDQETGRVIHAANGTGEVHTSGAGLTLSYKGVDMGAGAWSKTPLGVATRQAAENALAELLKGVAQMPWEGGVVTVKGPEKIFIDAGSELNLREGDRFRVVHRGDAITGPGGEVIGYDESEVGTVELVSVQAKMSVAKVVDGEAPQVGDKVRLPAQGGEG